MIVYIYSAYIYSVIYIYVYSNVVGPPPRQHLEIVPPRPQ